MIVNYTVQTEALVFNYAVYMYSMIYILNCEEDTTGYLQDASGI